MSGDGTPMPALLSPNTARGIRDALVDAERAEFERRFAEEMARAAETLDLGRVLHSSHSAEDEQPTPYKLRYGGR